MSTDAHPPRREIREEHLRLARELVEANPTRYVSIEVIENLRRLFGELP